ncbi:Hypothetical predicted protein, partial [Pelobates cultripes]
MERDKVLTRSLLNIMWSPNTFRTKRLPLYPTTKLTIKVWDKLLATRMEKGKYCAYAPVEVIEEVSQWLSLKPLASNALETNILAFPVLQEKYNLPNSLIFQYLQLKSIIQDKVTFQKLAPKPQESYALALIERCNLAPTKSKSLSLCYKTLLDTPTPQSVKYVTQWEQEGISGLTDGDWLGSLNALKGLTTCFSQKDNIPMVPYPTKITANLPGRKPQFLEMRIPYRNNDAPM